MESESTAPNNTPDRRKPLWEHAFLTALSTTGVIRYACEAADISRSAAYRHRNTDPVFAEAWDAALDDAADALEAEAVRRARLGVDEPVIYQGEMCGTWVDHTGAAVAAGTPGARLVPLTVKRYSDALLMFLLRAARPEKFRDRPPQLPPLEVLLAALPPDAADAVRRALAAAVHAGGDPGGGAAAGGA